MTNELFLRCQTLQTTAEALSTSYRAAGKSVALHNRYVTPIYQQVRDAEWAIESKRLDDARRELNTGEQMAREAKYLLGE